MGMIFRRKYKRRDGTIAEAAVWWLKFYVNGVPVRESAKTKKESVARQKLKLREGEAARGEPMLRNLNRMTVAELLRGVAEDYRMDHKKTLSSVERRTRLHLLPFFKATTNAARVTDADVRRFIIQRQEAGASDGEINRELAILIRGYRQARSTVTIRPEIKKLTEHNVRTGFFERDQFEAVLSHLPAPLQAVVTFAFITGWRIPSEVLTLQWRQVDFDQRTVRLDVGTTKNSEGRVFKFTAELARLLEAQRALTDAVNKARGGIFANVFHRDGEPIVDFYGAWRAACKHAGCPDRIPHDLRRTAVRNLVQAGVAERVAMKLTGHKTRAVFDRYHIVNEADLTDAAERLDRLVLGRSTRSLAQRRRSRARK